MIPENSKYVLIKSSAFVKCIIAKISFFYGFKRSNKPLINTNLFTNITAKLQEAYVFVIE